MSKLKRVYCHMGTTQQQKLYAVIYLTQQDFPDRPL